MLGKSCRTKIFSVLSRTYSTIILISGGGKTAGTQVGPQSNGLQSTIINSGFERLIQIIGQHWSNWLSILMIQSGAERLLARDDVRPQMAGRVDALLVDEFKIQILSAEL
jgi:hypothetical protein